MVIVFKMLDIVSGRRRDKTAFLQWSAITRPQLSFLKVCSVVLAFSAELITKKRTPPHPPPSIMFFY